MSLGSISIITINLNNAEGLRRTMQSVAAQTVKPQLVVIDGGSTDGSADILNDFSAHIFYKISEPDSGIYHAMNKGILAATGEYVLFLNSGDTLANKETLAEVSPYLKKGTGIVYGDLLFELNGHTERRSQPAVMDLDHMLKDTLWHPSAFIRRDLFSRIGSYDETYRIAGDYEFFFRAIVKHKVNTSYMPVAVSLYDQTGISSDLKNHPAIIQEKKRVWARYLDEASLKKMPESPALSWIQKLKRWFR